MGLFKDNPGTGGLYGNPSTNTYWGAPDRYTPTNGKVIAAADSVPADFIGIIPDSSPIPTAHRQIPTANNTPAPIVAGPYSYPAAKTKTAGTGLAMAAAAALIFFLR